MKRLPIKLKSSLVTMGFLIGLLGGAKDLVYVRAEEVSQMSQIMIADEDVDMKATPEKTAESIMSYQEGDSVFVVGETADGWYRVVYQDKEGYIPKGSLHEREIDVAELDAEMERTKQEAELVVETVERYREETRRSKIWGTVIVILVAGIFATGIISSVRGKREEEYK